MVIEELKYNCYSTGYIIAAIFLVFSKILFSLPRLDLLPNMDVNEDKLQVRNRAIGRLLAVSTQKYVANKLGKDIRTVRRWLARYNSSKDLQHRMGAGRPKC